MLKKIVRNTEGVFLQLKNIKRILTTKNSQVIIGVIGNVYINK
jgi:hypothetical protein